MGVGVIIEALIVGLSVLVGAAGICLYLRHLLNTKQAELEARVEDAVRSWIAVGAEDEKGNPSPSKLAVLMDSLGAVVGAAAARTIMASLRVDNSHVARVANGLADEVQGASNPILGLLMGGKRGKGAAVMRLAEIMQSVLAGGNGTGSAEVSVRNRLKGGQV